MCQDLERVEVEIDVLTKKDENDELRLAETYKQMSWASWLDSTTSLQGQQNSPCPPRVVDWGISRRDLSATRSLPPHARSHPRRMWVLVADFLSDRSMAPLLATRCPLSSPPHPLSLSPPPPLPPSTPPPPPPCSSARSFFPTCFVHASSQRVVFLLSSYIRRLPLHALMPPLHSHEPFYFFLPPPRSTSTDYSRLHDHGIAAMPSLFPHVI